MSEQTEQTIEVINPEPKHDMVLWIESRHSELESFCAHGIKPETLSKTIAIALMRDPKIGGTCPKSAWLAICYAAKLGLDPNGERNSAHFIAYKGKLKLMIGYGGLITLMTRNSGIVDIQCEVVFKGEEFEVLGGTDQTIHHKMDFALRNVCNYDSVIASYTVGTYKSGLKKSNVLSRRELDQIRSCAQRDNVWAANPIEMAKKSPLRNMSKWMDIAPAFDDALIISDESDGFGRRSVNNTGGMDNLRNKMGDLLGKQTPSPELPENSNHQSGEEFANDIAQHIENNTEGKAQ